MRVIHTVHSLRADHGGPSRSVTALCSDLARQDVDVSIVTRQRRPGEPPPVMPASERADVHFVEPEGGWHAFLPGAGQFGAAIRDTVGGGGGLVHDHGLWLPTNHASARAAARTGVPFVVSTRGMLTEWALRFNAGKKKAAWALYQRCDLQSARLFHATAEQEVEDIRRAGLRQPVVLIPNGVELPDRTREAPTGAVRKALFLSRVHPKKGLVNLARAWAEVRPEGWELVLAGPDEGGHRAEVEGVIRELGLEGVRWTGEVDDRAKWDLYYDADLFVLPTFSENFGIVVAEALAAGSPRSQRRGHRGRCSKSAAAGGGSTPAWNPLWLRWRRRRRSRTSAALRWGSAAAPTSKRNSRGRTSPPKCGRRTHGCWGRDRGHQRYI